MTNQTAPGLMGERAPKMSLVPSHQILTNLNLTHQRYRRKEYSGDKVLICDV